MSIAVSVFWASWALILYTYGIYPVILAVCAQLRKTKDRDATTFGKGELPRVAMVVAAYNEANVLREKLENTRQIDYPADRFELVIGSDGSSDGTTEILEAERGRGIRTFPFVERRGKISVLNDLVRQVDADIIVMSDANTIFAPDSVRKLVRHFEDPRIGCVSGELTLEQNGGVSGEGIYWRYEGWIKRNESRFGFLMGCNGGIYALRRELYEPLPSSTIVDDFVITMRVLEQGYRVKFEPEARAVEPPCPTARAEMIRKIRIGAGGFQALGLVGSLLRPSNGLTALGFWSHKVLRWLAPLFLIAALFANVALVGSNFYLILLSLQVSGALVASRAYDTRSGKTMPRWTRPVSYFYLMNYALFCGFLRFLFRTQRVTWDRASR